VLRYLQVVNAAGRPEWYRGYPDRCGHPLYIPEEGVAQAEIPGERSDLHAERWHTRSTLVKHLQVVHGHRPQGGVGMHHVAWSGALVPAPAVQSERISAPNVPEARAPPDTARGVSPDAGPGITLKFASARVHRTRLAPGPAGSRRLECPTYKVPRDFRRSSGR
jgi:hypothetical protein